VICLGMVDFCSGVYVSGWAFFICDIFTLVNLTALSGLFLGRFFWRIYWGIFLGGALGSY